MWWIPLTLVLVAVAGFIVAVGVFALFSAEFDISNDIAPMEGGPMSGDFPEGNSNDQTKEGI